MNPSYKLEGGYYIFLMKDREISRFLLSINLKKKAFSIDLTRTTATQ